jgi:hypothetical protein
MGGLGVIFDGRGDWRASMVSLPNLLATCALRAAEPNRSSHARRSPSASSMRRLRDSDRVSGAEYGRDGTHTCASALPGDAGNPVTPGSPRGLAEQVGA